MGMYASRTRKKRDKVVESGRSVDVYTLQDAIWLGQECGTMIVGNRTDNRFLNVELIKRYQNIAKSIFSFSQPTAASSLRTHLLLCSRTNETR